MKLREVRRLLVNISIEGHDGGTAHLFAPISASRAKYISRKVVEDFLSDREAYEDAVASQTGLVAVSYRSCFTESNLKSLFRERLFGAEVKELKDLTNVMLKAKLEEIAGKPRL